ncbi:serine/threonine protein phosphatase [Candidatus Babeliales bacterium]|nr:serine/threonine protein phosphatase [Candidatus Babeliales bacterium]
MKKMRFVRTLALALALAAPLNADLANLQQGLTALKSKLAQLGQTLDDLVNPSVVPPITPADITKLDQIQDALITKINTAANPTTKTPEEIVATITDLNDFKDHTAPQLNYEELKTFNEAIQNRTDKKYEPFFNSLITKAGTLDDFNDWYLNDITDGIADNIKIKTTTTFTHYLACNLALLTILYLERSGQQCPNFDGFVQLPTKITNLTIDQQKEIAQASWTTLCKNIDSKDKVILLKILRSASSGAASSSPSQLQTSIRELITNDPVPTTSASLTPAEIEEFYTRALDNIAFAFSKSKNSKAQFVFDMFENEKTPPLHLAFLSYLFAKDKEKIQRILKKQPPAIVVGLRDLLTEKNFNFLEGTILKSLKLLKGDFDNILSLQTSKPKGPQIVDKNYELSLITQRLKTSSSKKSNQNLVAFLLPLTKELTEITNYEHLNQAKANLKSQKKKAKDDGHDTKTLASLLDRVTLRLSQLPKPGSTTTTKSPHEIAQLKKDIDNLIKKIKDGIIYNPTSMAASRAPLNNVKNIVELRTYFRQNLQNLLATDSAISKKSLIEIFQEEDKDIANIPRTLKDNKPSSSTSSGSSSSSPSGTGGSTSTSAFDPSTLPAQKNPKVATAKNLTEWTTRCFGALPEYNCSSAQDAQTATDLRDVYRTALTDDQFITIMNEFVAQSKATLQHADAEWVNGAANKPTDKFFDLNEPMSEFDLAYIQKLIIPADNKVCFMGDYHGSVHSLLRNLWRLVLQGYLKDDFKLADKFHLIFLGDFVDRGRYGAEVWYTLMKLKLANWDKVHLLRGNHETEDISKRYGFLGWGSNKAQGEVYNKFTAKESEIESKILRLYNYLPFALFLSADGNDFVQCCHAGIALKDDGSFFNVTDFLAKPWPDIKFQKISEKQTGFQWSDFSQTGGLVTGARGVADAVTADIEEAKNYLTTNNLKAFFRGHQDQSFGFKMFFSDSSNTSKATDAGNYPNGPYHWQYVTQNNSGNVPKKLTLNNYVPIFTFTSASEGQSVPFDCFGIVTFGDGKYENWKLKIYETNLETIGDRNKNLVSIERSKTNPKELAISWSHANTNNLDAKLVTVARGVAAASGAGASSGRPPPPSSGPVKPKPPVRPLPKPGPTTGTSIPSSPGPVIPATGTSTTTLSTINADLKKYYDEANNLVTTGKTPFKINNNFVKRINTIRALDTTTTLDIFLGLDQATVKTELEAMVAFLTSKNSSKTYDAALTTLTNEIDKLK